MNDKIIIEIIKKIHLTLLTFFGFLFLITFLGFVVLVEGFTISHLKLGDIVLEKVYLKWDNRLHLQASLIDLSALKKDNKPLDLEPLKQLPTYIKWIEGWTYSINIDTIRYDDITASLHYTKNKIGRLQLHKGKIDLAGNFILTPDTLQSNLSTPQSNLVYADGNISIDIPKQRFWITSSLTVKDTPKLHISVTGDTQHLTLALRADSPFKRIDKLIDTIGLDSSVRPWIVNNLVFKDAVLEECKVDLDYKGDPLRTIIIKGSVHNASYTFAQGIAPIVSPAVNLIFKNKRLTISPINATFNSLPLEKSNLNFDFTAPDTLLNIHLLTAHAQLNDTIIDLLKYYKILIPVRQNNGLTAVDMNLNINLSTEDIKVKGLFVPTASSFALDKFIVQSRGGKVTLNDSKVNISGFRLINKEYGEGDVSGVYNGTNASGQIRIHPIRFSPQDNISLLPLSSTVTLHLSPKKNILEVPPTQWKAFNEIIHFTGFKIPINLSKSSLLIPSIKFSILDKASGILHGKYDHSHLNVNLILDQFNIDNIQLKSYPLNLSLYTDGSDLNISSKLASTWHINDEKVIISPFSLQVNQLGILLNDTRVLINTLLSSNVNGNYNWKSKTGNFNLNKTTVLDPKISHYFTLKSPQTFAVDFSKQYPRFRLNKLDTTIEGSNLGWKINIDDLSSLHTSIPLLKQYDVTNGNISLLYKSDTKKITFNGALKHPYKLILLKNNTVSKYTFTGTYENKILNADINDQLHVTYDENIVLNAKNLVINLPELLRWIDNHSNTAKNTPNVSDDNPSITFDGKNVTVRLTENRQIPADSLIALFHGDDGYASLKYADGVAKMNMKNGIFYLEGSNFNNQFMENIFAYSDFIGGSLSFTLKGENELYEGLIRIEKVTLKQFKLLNNILAFTGTISTLTSFSLPNYNQDGLFVNEAYTHFNYTNNKLEADTFVINSPEVLIGGDFTANTQKDTIKGSMSLKTNIASTVGHIPLVGYLLLGKDGSLSTTVAVSGKLSDPSIDTGVAKELAVAPYNILKRTVTYPFGWMMDDGKKK